MSEVIYGKNSLLETIRSNASSIIKIYLLKEDQDVLGLIKDKNLYKVVNKDVFNKILKDNNITNVNHQGMMALVKEYQYYDLDNIISSDNDSLVVMLDGLEDPHTSERLSVLVK